MDRPDSDHLVRFVELYKDGEYSDGALDRVQRWLSMFPKGHREAIASELVHVLQKAFVTKEKSVAGLRYWAENACKVSGGVVDSWKYASFLPIQRQGKSQETLLGLLDKEMRSNGKLSIKECTGRDLFVYVDDISVQGTRILNDLSPWLIESAPNHCTVLIALQRRLAGQVKYIETELRKKAETVGKNIRVLWWSDRDFSKANCYYPATIPNNAAVLTYLYENRISPPIRTHHHGGVYFSSDLSRGLLETALLEAGVGVLLHNPNLKPREYMRPLGNTIWRGKGLGIGVPIITWRNCPNSAPLALWAEGQVPALFPRMAN